MNSDQQDLTYPPRIEIKACTSPAGKIVPAPPVKKLSIFTEIPSQQATGLVVFTINIVFPSAKKSNYYKAINRLPFWTFLYTIPFCTESDTAPLSADTPRL